MFWDYTILHEKICHNICGMLINVLLWRTGEMFQKTYQCHPHNFISRWSRRAALDDDLDTTLRASLVWREQEELRRSVPGIGPVCARTLVLDLPA
jgi:hypothetical protein